MDKQPTWLESVKFTIEVQPEDIPIRGNAIASGDEEYDKKVEDELIERVNRGDVWAWSLVIVKAEYAGLTGTDCLGGCSYTDEQDFKDGGYYQDMKERALEDLVKQVNYIKEMTQ